MYKKKGKELFINKIIGGIYENGLQLMPDFCFCYTLLNNKRLRRKIVWHYQIEKVSFGYVYPKSNRGLDKSDHMKARYSLFDQNH